MTQNVAVRPRIMQRDDRKTHTGNIEQLREMFDSRGVLCARRTTIFLLFTSAYFISQFLRSAKAVIALAQIPLGIGLDRWGPRWLTSGLMALGVIGSLLFALAPSIGVLALGRALLGLVIGLFPADAAGHYPAPSYVAVLLLAAGGILVAFVWYAPLLDATEKPDIYTERLGRLYGELRRFFGISGG